MWRLRSGRFPSQRNDFIHQAAEFIGCLVVLLRIAEFFQNVQESMQGVHLFKVFGNIDAVCHNFEGDCMGCNERIQGLLNQRGHFADRVFGGKRRAALAISG